MKKDRFLWTVDDIELSDEGGREKKDHSRHYAKSEYEKRTDFALIESIYDRDALEVDLNLRLLLTNTREQYSDMVESLLNRGMTARTVRAFKIDSGPQVERMFADYLKAVWCKTRDAAIKEFPAKIKTKVEPVKWFANVGFEPIEALEYLENRAFEAKGLIDTQLSNQARNLLYQHLKRGRTILETIGDLRDLFEPYIGDPSKIQSSGQVGIGFPPGVKGPENILMAYRLENVIRTTTSDAIAQARATIGDASDGYVIGYEMSPILDERTSPSCKQIGNTDGGLIVKSSDGRLPRLMPPLHYQCRTTPVFVTQDDSPVEFSTDSEINAVLELVKPDFK